MGKQKGWPEGVNLQSSVDADGGRFTNRGRSTATPDLTPCVRSAFWGGLFVLILR